MRPLVFFLVVFLLAGCSARYTGTKSESEDIRFVVGARFSVSVSSEDLAGASVMSADGFIISYADGSHLSFNVLMPQPEGLPDSFDMRKYPEYLLGLRDSSDLSSDQAGNFEVARDILLSSVGEGKQSRYTDGPLTAYVISGDVDSLAFVTDASVTDQLLFVSSFTGGVSGFKEFLKGVNHADR